MANGTNINRHSAADLDERRARGESKTDFVRVRALGDDEVERAALQQLKEDGVATDWFKDAEPAHAQPKKLLSLRLDPEIVDWFRSRGPGYQTRINAVLRAYIKHAGQRAAAAPK